LLAVLGFTGLIFDYRILKEPVEEKSRIKRGLDLLSLDLLELPDGSLLGDAVDPVNALVVSLP